MKATNIRWAADPDIARNLPSEIEIPRKVRMQGVDAISRFVSNQTGYSHLGFAIRYTQSELKQHERRLRLSE